MQFTATTVPQLYTATGNGTATPGSVLYLLPQATANPPTPLSFGDAWTTYAGTYIFLEAALAAGTEAAFAAAAWAYLADPRKAGTRFAWFQALGTSGILNGTTIAVAGNVTSAAATFQQQNVTLFVPASSAVAADATNFAFTFTAPSAARPIQLLASWGSAAVDSASAATLPLDDNLAGSLQFTLALTQQNLVDLDVSLRYFYAVPPDPTKPTAPALDFLLDSLRYPLFSAGITVYANVDPLAWQNPARTFFAFNGADAGQSGAGAAPAIPSYFASTMGDAYKVQPLTGSAAPTAFAALVFAANRQSSSPSQHDPLYLVPRGDFALQSTAAGGPNALMCGLSGVEYGALQGPTNVVSFFPGSAAFAAGFFPGQQPGWTTLHPASTALPTTSFSSLSIPSAGFDYYAQPDQSVLYNYPAAPTKGVAVTALAPVAVLAATIPWPPVSTLSFPLLPYGGLGGANLDPYRQLESQIVSPARRLALAPAAPKAALGAAAAAPPGSTYSTTPQGLLAQYTPGATTWPEIVLAQSGLGTVQQLLLQNVTGDLLSAFQSNKLFLVITNAAALGAALAPPNAAVQIGSDPAEMWDFDLEATAANWQHANGNDTIFIVKFYDMPIAELAGQISTWSYPSSGPTPFNVDAAATSAQIQAIIAKVDATDPDFAAFVNAVTNPHWNGILALNVTSPLTSLPSELAGLAAGIDPALFFAHHVGINASAIVAPATPANITISNSSIFGLINYVAPGPLPAGGVDYAFQVQQLKVVFANSAVTSFSSIIQLEVNTLFGEPATLRGGTDNIIELYGVYQKHVVNNVVEESYTFTTPQNTDLIFDMTSNVLNAVQVNNGQFVTLTAQSTPTLTMANFVFWGLLDFKALVNGAAAFDVFSFGRVSGTTPAGLSFGNLLLDMQFDPQIEPPDTVFAFDASQLSFDLATSTWRPDSFFQHFPLTLAGFTQAATGTTPTGQGWMSVTTPLTQSSLAYPWFSLNFNLNLGSAGALAAEVGFVGSITAAWSPNITSDYTVFTGLKLPGSSGAKRAISIEGLFDITFKTLQILAPKPDTFILVLFGIGFKFLSFTFPPTGQVNFVLFGDPNATAKAPDASLGWYAAYAKPTAKPSGGGSTMQAVMPAGQSAALPGGAS